MGLASLSIPKHAPPPLSLTATASANRLIVRGARRILRDHGARNAAAYVARAEKSVAGAIRHRERTIRRDHPHLA